MTDVPIIVIFLIYGLSFGLMALAYIYRTSFPMSFIWFMIGSLSLIMFFTTDNITLESFVDGMSENTYAYNVESRGGTVTINSLSNIAVAEFVSSSSSALVGDKINCIDMFLQKSGSPTGIATIGTLGGTGLIIQSFGTIDVSTLTTSAQWKTFCLPADETYVIQNQDRLGLRYTGGDATNTLLINVDNNDPFDGTITFRQGFVASWSSTTTSDHTQRMYLLGSDSQLINNNFAIRNPQTFEPTFIGLVFIFLSLSFLMVGILIEKFT